MEIRTRKPALATLLQRGVVGDEIFQRLQRAEQELEEELKDVVAEANALASGWGKTIFQSAGEMVQNQMLRERLERIKGTIPDEKRVWEETRERARKELEGDAKMEKTKAPASTNLPPASESVSAATSAKPVTVGSSDEDTVLVDVETPGGDNDPAATGGGSKRKKKNKK